MYNKGEILVKNQVMVNKFSVSIQYLVPQRLLSKFVGTIAKCHIEWLKTLLIKLFIKKYDVDLTMAKKTTIEQYKSFNDFFIRELVEGARPVDKNNCHVISPVDALVSQIGQLDRSTLIQAKGMNYDLNSLLAGDTELVYQFTSGSYVTLYLSPKDYHRVHMPMTGLLKKTIFVPGKLFSVNPTTAASIPNLFSKNERLIAVFESDQGDSFAVIMVGAMLVSGINSVWAGKYLSQSVQQKGFSEKRVRLLKGEELGYFNFGSTVIMLFQPNKLCWTEKIKSDSAVLMGQGIGELIDK